MPWNAGSDAKMVCKSAAILYNTQCQQYLHSFPCMSVCMQQCMATQWKTCYKKAIIAIIKFHSKEAAKKHWSDMATSESEIVATLYHPYQPTQYTSAKCLGCGSAAHRGDA